jgi:hypothetical protein
MKKGKLRYRLEVGQPCVDADRQIRHRFVSAFWIRLSRNTCATQARISGGNAPSVSCSGSIRLHCRASSSTRSDPHFEDLLERLRRRNHQRRSTGYLALAYGCRSRQVRCRWEDRELSETRGEQLASADVALDPADWHKLAVRMRGERIECELDGRLLLEASDATFAGAGRIGLWTKADARTAFDDLALKVSAPVSR